LGYPELRIAIEYEGDHHRFSPAQYAQDIRRKELFEAEGWVLLRVAKKSDLASFAKRLRHYIAKRSPSHCTCLLRVDPPCSPGRNRTGSTHRRQRNGARRQTHPEARRNAAPDERNRCRTRGVGAGREEPVPGLRSRGRDRPARNRRTPSISRSPSTSRPASTRRWNRRSSCR